MLPLFRSYIARELIEKYGLTQVDVARRLGITQAAISQYLRSKRGYKGLEGLVDVMAVIKSAASDVAGKIASGEMDPEGISLKFCELCLSIQKRKNVKEKFVESHLGGRA